MIWAPKSTINPVCCFLWSVFCIYRAKIKNKPAPALYMLKALFILTDCQAMASHPLSRQQVKILLFSMSYTHKAYNAHNIWNIPRHLMQMMSMVSHCESLARRCWKMKPLRSWSAEQKYGTQEVWFERSTMPHRGIQIQSTRFVYTRCESINRSLHICALIHRHTSV